MIIDDDILSPTFFPVRFYIIRHLDEIIDDVYVMFDLA